MLSLWSCVEQELSVYSQGHTSFSLRVWWSERVSEERWRTGVKFSTWRSKSSFCIICNNNKYYTWFVFPERLALKSEEVKTPQQMRPKGHNYREGICTHTEWGGKLQWAQELPPSTNHLPAPCKSTLLYFQDAMGGLLPIQPRLCPQSSHSLELAAHTCVLSHLPAWRPCSHLWTTSRTHPSRMCCALPQGANRALNPQLAQLPKPDWTYSGRKRLEWIEKVWSLYLAVWWCFGEQSEGASCFLIQFFPMFCKESLFFCKMKGKQRCY